MTRYLTVAREIAERVRFCPVWSYPQLEVRTPDQAAPLLTQVFGTLD